jgi:hypothetical protein
LTEEGPTYDEVKAQQTPANETRYVFDAAKDIVHMGVTHHLEDLAVEAAAHMAKNSFGAAGLAGKISLVGGALATFHLAVEVTVMAHELAVEKPMEKGKQLNEGIERDQKNLTLLMIVQVAQPDVLPAGYMQSEYDRVLHAPGKAAPFSGSAFQKASVILGKAETDPEIARSRDILVASVREGVSTAYQIGIDSEEAVSKLKTSDPAFRSRYESDPAFRNGIQSVVWQAKTHREDFDTGVALSVGYHLPTTRI